MLIFRMSTATRDETIEIHLTDRLLFNRERNYCWRSFAFYIASFKRQTNWLNILVFEFNIYQSIIIKNNLYTSFCHRLINSVLWYVWFCSHHCQIHCSILKTVIFSVYIQLTPSATDSREILHLYNYLIMSDLWLFELRRKIVSCCCWLSWYLLHTYVMKR